MEKAMNDEKIGQFNDSLERASACGLLDLFYELFLASSTEIEEKFKHTEFNKQKRLLKTSLYLMMIAEEEYEGTNLYLERVAINHNKKHLNIRPELYDTWLECLIQAVSKTDPNYSPELEQIWRMMMQRGVAIMKSYYDLER